MQINLTIFVQFINFAITYWFLNKFMFKPVLIFISKKKSEENYLNNKIKQKEELIKILENKKTQNYNIFIDKINTEYKFNKFTFKNFPELASSQIDKQQADNLIHKIKKILKERVPHVD